MKSSDLPSMAFPALAAMAVQEQSPGGRFSGRVKELSERDRRALLMHFLALSGEDRLLRFGSLVPDESITRYVQRLDFSRDTVFGVYDAHFALVGVGHLAFVLREALPVLSKATLKARVAEFGLSVSAPARGLGIGVKLFERAALHCRNHDVDTVYMQGLLANPALVHIAEKAGMTLHHDAGAAEAYLKLAPLPRAVLPESEHMQFSVFDPHFKTNVKNLPAWWKKAAGAKEK